MNLGQADPVYLESLWPETYVESSPGLENCGGCGSMTGNQHRRWQAHHSREEVCYLIAAFGEYPRVQGLEEYVNKFGHCET